MSSYTRDAIITFVIAFCLLAGLATILYFVNKDNATKERTEQTRVTACRSIESEALRTMCINGHG